MKSLLLGVFVALFGISYSSISDGIWPDAGMDAVAKTAVGLAVTWILFLIVAMIGIIAAMVTCCYYFCCMKKRNYVITSPSHGVVTSMSNPMHVGYDQHQRRPPPNIV